MADKNHWEKVYQSKANDSVSWYQEHADLSLRLIDESAVDKSAALMDIGGGASTLVDDLLRKGFGNISVVDLSAAALAAAQKRLGLMAAKIIWIEADITQAQLPPASVDLWHDRAVFHFLTSESDRAAYLQLLLQTLKPSGYLLLATFAEDGPQQCSGLAVRRYSAAELGNFFGSYFSLVVSEKEVHQTPFNTTQNFVYCLFKRHAFIPE